MAVSYIGASNLIATNGGAPGAITVNASTQIGDLLIWYHYSRATGGNETVSFPAGWNTIFNSVTANNGLVAAAWRVRATGDTTYTATITNHTSSNSGETVLQHIETYRGQRTTDPIVNATAALSTWASSLNLGSIAAPATATVGGGCMVVVFAGRFENITAQTVLTGDSLTWTNRTLNDSTLGLDAACVTQTGLNPGNTNLTVTAKTITTTGTTGAGAGRMFIIEEQPPTVSETVAANDTVTVVSGGKSLPNVLGTPTKGVTASGTSHTVTLPSGIQSGEILMIAVSSSDNSFGSGFTDSFGNYWRLFATISNPTGNGSGFYWTYASGAHSGTVTFTTSVARVCAWACFRIGDPDGTRKVKMHSFTRDGDSNTTTLSMSATFGVQNGNVARNGIIVYVHGLTNTNTVTVGPSSGFSLVVSNMGSGDGVTVGGLYVQDKQVSLAAYEEVTFGNMTTNANNTGYCHGVLVTFVDEDEDVEPINGAITRDIFAPWPEQGAGINATNNGMGQTFRASGGAIKRAIVFMMRQNSLHTGGTLVAKIYAHTGTYGTSGLPTGAALAPSNSVSIDNIPVAPTTYTKGAPVEFVFSTPYQTTNGTDYVLTVEGTGLGTTYVIYPIISGSPSYGGNRVINTGGTWSANTTDLQIQLLKSSGATPGAIAETNAVTDTPTATNATTGAMAESVSIADTPNATKATSAAITETNAITDSPNATRSTPAAISESVATSDLPNATKTVPGAIAESVTSSDTPNATKATSESIAETNAVTDSPNATKTTNGVIAETNPVTDSPNAVNATSAAITESVTISDTQDGTVVGQAQAIQENVASSDTPNATLATSAAQSESNAINDSPNATNATSAAMAESVATSDTPNANKTTAGSISESVAVSDTPNAVKTVSAAITEGVSISDSPDGALAGANIIAESVAASDAPNANKTTSASQSETNPITDTTNATKDTSAAMVESVAVNDSQSASKNVTGVISESCSVTDLITAAVITSSAVISETVAVNDTINNTKLTLGQIVESSTIGDLVNGTTVVVRIPSGYYVRAKILNAVERGSVVNVLKIGKIESNLTHGEAVNAIRISKMSNQLLKGTIVNGYFYPNYKDEPA